MPGAAFHSLYWQTQPDAPDDETVIAAYPAWQAAVITPSLFGSFQIMYEWLIRKDGK